MGFTNENTLPVPLGHPPRTCSVPSHIPASQRSLSKPRDCNGSLFLLCVISQQCFTAGLRDLQQTAFICHNQHYQFYRGVIRPTCLPVWVGEVSKVLPIWAGLSSWGTMTNSQSNRSLSPFQPETLSPGPVSPLCERQHFISLMSLTHTGLALEASKVLSTAS